MYSIFEKLAANKGVTAYFVGKETGVSYATLSSWKKGRYHPKDDKLERIAEYFEVPLDYLKGNQKEMPCPHCHMMYNPIDKKSYVKHQEFHARFMDMQKRYRVEIPSREECERKRVDGLMILRDIKYDKFRRISAFDKYAKYDFLLKLYETDFEVDLDLDEHSKELAENLRPDTGISLNLCNAIRKEYGVDEYKQDLSFNITEREYRMIRHYREMPKDAAALVETILRADDE